MSDPWSEDPNLQRIIAWASGRPDVRAAILTSSRCNPFAPVDRLSDYDVIFVVENIHPYHQDETWMGHFGRVLVLWRDPIHLRDGLETFARIIQYEDNGLKIDFTFWPVELLRRVAALPKLPEELDIGYRVLLDKDGLTASLQPPTYRAHIPSPPAEAEYLEVIQVFFHEATYVAKHLWRDDLMAAKHLLETEMITDQLRRMLEWRMEIDHDWSIKPGVNGRGLKRYIRPALWRDLERAYVGPGNEENWGALFAAVELMRTVGREVGQNLGYAYPVELHARVIRHLEWVQNLEK